MNVIEVLKKRYDLPIGYSDHSAQTSTLIAAATLGAEVLEFHAVFDRENDKGPDAKSSLEIDEIKQLAQNIKRLDIARQHPVDKSDNSAYTHLKSIFEKSLAVNKDLNEGHIISFEDLEAKKPKGYGIEASKFKEVIGKPLSRKRTAYDFLNWDDFKS